MYRLNLAYIKKYFYLFCLIGGTGAVATCAEQLPEASLGANIIVNTGFENGTHGWSIPSKTAFGVNDVAYGGVHSLYYKNTNPNSYKLFTQHIEVKPGQKLHFSVWVKGNNIAGQNPSRGAGVFIESYEPSGKYIGGSFPKNLHGTFNWQLIEGEYVVPVNAGRTRVGLFFNRGVTGEAWFDEVVVRVQEQKPFKAFLQYPNYRGMVVQKSREPWKTLVRIDAPPRWKAQTVSVKSVLRDSKDTVLAEQNTTLPALQKEAEVVFSPPADLPIGRYLFEQTIIDPEGQIGMEQRHPIQVVAAMPKVHIDREGFTVVEGKRFFPLGLYMGSSSHTTDEHLSRIAAGKFNTILCYGYGSTAEPESYLKRAEQHNLKVIYSLVGMYPDMPKSKVDSFDVARQHVTSLKEAPALLAWYINDEIGVEYIPKIQQMNELVSQNDALHPTYQVLDKISEVQNYYSVSDVMGTDPYPVGRSDLTNTSTHTRIASFVAHNAKGLWMVPQIMDWGVYRTDRKSHPPSLDEMRNQAYQAIINGAKGLIFYSYHDLFFEKYPRSNRTRNLELFERRWKDVATMGQEVNQLIPAILDGRRIDLELPTDSRIELTALEYQNELLVLAANPYYQQEKISLDIPTGWMVKETSQEAMTGSQNGRKLSLILPAMGSGVFRLERKN